MIISTTKIRDLLCLCFFYDEEFCSINCAASEKGPQFKLQRLPGDDGLGHSSQGKESIRSPRRVMLSRSSGEGAPRSI